MLSNNEIISTPFHAENKLFPFSIAIQPLLLAFSGHISAALLLANKQPSLTSSYFLDFLSFSLPICLLPPFFMFLQQASLTVSKASFPPFFSFFCLLFSQSWHRLHFCLCSHRTASYNSMPSPVAGKHTVAHRQPNPFFAFHSLPGNTTYGCSSELHELWEDTKLRNK